MRVFIDNKKIENFRRYNSFVKCMRAIQEILINENKMLGKIYIDGRNLDRAMSIDMKKIKVIEITTVAINEVILNCILSAREQLKIFFEIFYDSLEKIEPNEIEERIEFLRWLSALLNNIEKGKHLEFVYGDFKEYTEDIEQELRNIEEAYKNGDYETAVEILNFSVLELLESFYNNIDNYYWDILEDENRKRLLN